MNQDQATEKAIVAAGANLAPRVTPADIEAEIVSEHYFTAKEAAEYGPGSCNLLKTPTGLPNSLELLTFCVLVLSNGFTVTGESACVSPENYNEAIGRKIARDKAVEKMWPLLGFRLRDALHDEPVLAQAGIITKEFRDRALAIHAEELARFRDRVKFGAVDAPAADPVVDPTIGQRTLTLTDSLADLAGTRRPDNRIE